MGIKMLETQTINGCNFPGIPLDATFYRDVHIKIRKGRQLKNKQTNNAHNHKELHIIQSLLIFCNSASLCQMN